MPILSNFSTVLVFYFYFYLVTLWGSVSQVSRYLLGRLQRAVSGPQRRACPVLCLADGRTEKGDTRPGTKDSSGAPWSPSAR